MNPLVASVIRTIVPAAVGQVAAWLALLNVPLTPEAEVGLTSFLGFAFTAIYFIVVRVIEQEWPSVGILLGLPKSPDSYSKSVDTAAQPAAPTKGAEVIVPAPATVYPSEAVAAAEASAPADSPIIVAPEADVPDGTHTI